MPHVVSLPVEFLFTITVTTDTTGIIARGPHGTRVIVDASTGTFEGPKLKGNVKGPGGDWLTIRPDGVWHLNVRVLLETDDGAAILMQYTGIGVDGGANIRTTPLFETGDERYAWLNSVQGVAHGSVGDGNVTYDVYALR
jgi:hypothetical protein